MKGRLQEWRTILDRLTMIGKNFKLLKDLVDSLTSYHELSKAQISMLRLTYISSMVEGPFTSLIDQIIYLLIAGGHHDFWSEQGQKFITQPDEIRRAPLYQKLEFLENHGLKSLSETYPRDMRNAIVHQDYLIEQDGTVQFRKGKLTTKELFETVKDFEETIGDILKWHTEQIEGMKEETSEIIKRLEQELRDNRT